MNLEQLEYIVEVSKVGLLSEASKNLHVTQSAISQSITNLENELNVKIFNRSRMGSTPTETGKQMIKKAIETLNNIQDFKDIAYVNAHSIKGELRIGTIPGPLTLLPSTLSAYKKDFPNVQLYIEETSSKEIIDAIKADVLDIGLVGLTREGKEMKDNDINIEVVLRGKMIVAASKHSILALSGTVTPEEIRKHTLVIYNDDRMWEFINDFVSAFGPVDILFSTNNMDAIRNAVHENLAITIGPDYTVENDSSFLSNSIVSIKIAELEQDYPGMALVWAKARQDSPIINNFISRLKEQLSRF